MRLLEFFRPFRVIVTRRVSEEEQVSVECIAKSQDQIAGFSTHILQIMRDHRRRTNEEVIRVTQQQLVALETSIEAKGEVSRGLDELVAQKHAEIMRLDQLLKGKREKAGITDLRHPNPINGG